MKLNKALAKQTKEARLVLNKLKKIGSHGAYVYSETQVDEILERTLKGIREVVDNLMGRIDEIEKRIPHTKHEVSLDDLADIGYDISEVKEDEERLMRLK